MPESPSPRIGVDTIKAIITYATAGILVLGGTLALIAVEMPPDKLAIVAGIVGFAAQFMFGQETATRTARQVISAQQTNGTQRETLRGA